MKHKPLDRTKLGPRFRAELERLEANVAHWKRQAYGAEHPDETDVAIRVGHEERRGLPVGTRIEFTLGLLYNRPVTVCAYVAEPGKLEIRSNEGRLVIEPHVSNVIRVRPERL